LPPRGGGGHLRIQARPVWRRDARRAGRRGSDAAADRAVRAGALPYGPPRVRVGRSRRLALSQRGGKRPSRRNSIGRRVSPSSARSAAISPTAGANLNPCPEQAETITTFSASG